MAETTITGSAPTYTAIWSAICTQVSSTPTSQGRYRRPPSRSIASQMSSNGTPVPTCSGEDSSRPAVARGPGASMMPTVTSTRSRASVPVARPLASTAASRTSSV